MKKILSDIREKTSGMDKRESCSYIITYYWYYILGIFLVVALILLFVFHYVFGNEKPLFTCVIVNQRIDNVRDNRITCEFSEHEDLPTDRIIIDSNYNFSYGDVKLEEVNESSYEKFFLQWHNHELDGIIIPKSFYDYCKEVGGVFRNLSDMDTGNLLLYEDEGIPVAVILGETYLKKDFNKDETEILLLAFPENSMHKEACQKFLNFIIQSHSEEIGDWSLEENVD